ncbi:MAG: hypothetical protein LC793_08445, partial [Thermomicrobia bacterium]|nr:hypothetical protein [Thermomicrobia bacterium]
LVGKRGRPVWMLAAIGSAWYLRRPYRRLRPMLGALSTSERAAAIALVPLLRAIGDVAKMCGYPVGLIWRLQRRGFGWTWRDAVVRQPNVEVPGPASKGD